MTIFFKNNLVCCQDVLSSGPLVLIERRFYANQYAAPLTVMKHFYPDGYGLFQNKQTPIHRAQGFTECFDESPEPN